MPQFLLTVVFAACLAAAGQAAPSGPPPFSRESIEWCDIWISHADETNLPRVLLIGDSISRDYYPGVEKRLAGKAYVARLSTSAFVSDPVLLQEIKMVLGEYRFDVIHFNNGMHGWQHSEKAYQQAFPKFLKTIQKDAPGAKLVWATTTPLKVSPKLPPNNQTQATDERIAARNAIALKFVQAEGIPVDDLNALVRGHPEYHSDNVHFNSQGIELEAAQVAAQIEKQLNP
ncbi:MAG TPA: SGNH/GDSL hydrolase family protein [Verrucomicrobiae bacterium]|nr:SGNH/GDSL hydrolase family protein [Verrucomicrobiae bacterium]